MKILSTLLAAIALVSMAIPTHLYACCMVPLKYDVAISQKSQEAILFHDGDREELILKIHYQIEAKKKDAKMPGHFAWIITVPNEPDNYEIADADLFEEVYDWSRPLIKKPEPGGLRLLKSAVDSAQPTNSIELSELVEVGPYKIQPVRGVGPNALTGLNDWLKENDFPTEDPAHMAYFVENNFTFLAVKVLPAEGKAAVTDSAELPPIHLSFKSENPYYPLRFSSRQGVFNLNLTVFTRNKLNYRKSKTSLGKINFTRGKYKENVEVDSSKFPEHLTAAFKKSHFKDDEKKEWKLNVLRSRSVNHGNTIAQWKEDIFFSTAKGFFGRQEIPEDEKTALAGL